MSDKVEKWFDALSDNQKPLLGALRTLVLDTGEGMVEELKWGQPCYSGNHLFCYLQKARDHVTLGFQQGAHLEDPGGVLQGDGKDMRHIRFGTVNDLDRDVCRALIAEAIRFDRGRSG